MMMQRQSPSSPGGARALFSETSTRSPITKRQLHLLEDKTGSPRSSSLPSLRPTKELLNQANQCVKNEQFSEALRLHDKALEAFRRHPTSSVAVWCSEATAWRNKAAIHQRLKDFRAAIAAWKKSEDLFRSCRERLAEAAPAVIKKSSPRYFPPEKQICLESCLVEVLQSRANTHLQLKDQFRDAIACHEEVIDLLLDIHRAGKHDFTNWQIPLDGLGFIRMDPTQNTEALLISLESLGGLYTSTGAYEDGLAAFEEALQILRARKTGSTSKGSVVQSMSNILFSLSELYLERNDLDRTIDMLFETLDLRVSIEEEEGVMSNETREALEALDKAGQVAEQVGNLESAIACYEKALLTRNMFWGDQHIDVAKSLVNVGRVLELQGNTEGSLDLYRAAQVIYASQVTADDFKVSSEEAETVLQLIPSLLEQERFEEAVAYLNKCLELEDDREEKKTEVGLDRNQIYFFLGEAYIGLGDYVSATVCLVECAKQEEGSVPDHDIQMMLERVEFLKRNESSFDNGENDLPTSHPSRSRLPSHELSSRSEAADDADHIMPVTPTASKGGKSIDEGMIGRPSSTPMTEDISQNDSSHNISGGGASPTRSTLGGSPSRSTSTRKSKGFSTDHDDSIAKDLATTRFSMEQTAVEQPIHKRGSSDLSSSAISSNGGSDITSALDLSNFDELTETGDHSGVLEEVPSPTGQGLLETDSLLKPSLTSDSYDRRKNRKLRLPSARKKGGSMKSPESLSSKSRGKKSRNFRTRRGHGFQSLVQEEETKVAAEPILKREEEYHDDPSQIEESKGPIKQFLVPAGSWDDVSQITFINNDATQGSPGNEWWWGVTSDGFGGWFPSQIVTQAVEAAEGFLSAKAVHSRVKSAPLDVMSDDESTDSNLMEEKDHASTNGVAKKEQTPPTLLLGSDTNITETDAEVSKVSRDLQAMILASSESRKMKKDSSDEDLSKHKALLAEQRSTLHPQDSQIASTLFHLALLQSRSGDITNAIQSSTEALHINQNNGDGIEVANNYRFLAELCLHQKNFKSCLSYYTDALEIQQEVYGENSEECAKTLNSIGAVRSMQNEFKLAMESHKEALRVLKECLGDDLHGNSLVSQTLCQIGAVYYRERNALSTIKAKKDDYSTFVEAGMLEVIGRAHEERGSYKMAIAFFEEKLQFLENDNSELGSSQEDLATTLNSLGMLSSRAGLYMEALGYYDRALAVQKDLGCDEIYLATAQVLKGTVQYQIGHWSQSFDLLQGALATLRGELGDHETVAATLYHIGVVKAALFDYDSAMAALKSALDIQTGLLGADHPAALRTQREIGNLFAVYPSEMDTALEHFIVVLKGQKDIHGDKHPNVAETLHAIGCAYARKGDFSMALKTLEECYYMRLEFLGVDHPLQATTLHEIAKIHLKRESFKKASKICDSVLEIRKESLSEGHIDYARALATKGASLVGRGDFKLALSLANESLRVCTEAVDHGHPVIAEVNVIIATIHLRNCQFTEAQVAVDKALSIYREANIDDDYPGIQEASALLERIERDEMLFV